MENVLKDWQTKISEEEYLTEIKAGNRLVGCIQGVYYRTDMTHPGYVAKIKEKHDKRKAKLDKKRAYVEQRIANALTRGKRLGKIEYRKSESFKKAMMRAEKKGMQLAKPKISAEEKLKKFEEKIKIMENKKATILKSLEDKKQKTTDSVKN